MLYCMLILIVGLPKFGYTFWPASYRIDLNDRKTFVITAGEDSDEENDESENEMIQPEDLVDIGSLADDEDRYKPLHSHVEHYNRRAAEAEPRLHESVPYLEAKFLERNPIDDEKPFIAGFKHELDKYNFNQATEVVIISPAPKRQDLVVKPYKIVKRSVDDDFGTIDKKLRRITKREDEDSIFGSTEVAGDLVETISLRNHSMPHGEYTGHATPHPKDQDDPKLESDIHDSEDYDQENTSMMYEHSASKESKGNEKQFFQSDVETTEASLEESEEEDYDYENFRAEYEQQIEDAKSNNITFNYTENGEPEETAEDAIKKIVEFDMPKNCTKEELSQFGVKALECLAFDYRNARNQSDVRRILARTWSVVKVWICIYLVIAVPCWCQKGWCCCCFRCKLCFPEERIYEAKHYYANNPPGILVDQPRENGQEPEPIEYKPTLFELDAYENFESAIRNL